MPRSTAVALCLVVMTYCAPGVEVSGKVEKPIETLGAGVDYTLVGDTQFGWTRKPFTGDLAIGSHTFTMETGGGNVTVFSGVISGSGRFVWNGGGNAAWQTTASYLKGGQPNTFSGTFTLLRGTLALAKPAGVDALAGDIVLGGGSNQAILRLDASDQIRDSSSILITGKHEGRIWTQGFSERVGALTLQSRGEIDLGDGASTLVFADSSGAAWDPTKTLTVRRWTEGRDKVVFTPPGLTAKQVARVGFLDPSGRQPGMYAATLSADGQLLPGAKVAPVDPPFDMSEKAVAAREAIYDVPGRAMLSGEGTRLKDGMTISFFGDSITWLNGYITAIGKALEEGAGTKGMAITLRNRGVNGGGVLSIRDGSEKAAYVSAKEKNGKQAPFADVIAADRADVAVVFIGINDVWWRKTPPETFHKALLDMAASAKARGTKLVLVTLSVYQEKPDGSNPKDDGCEQFAAITRAVTEETGATLVDLRTVHIAYLRNHNAELRVDGSLGMVASGVLTYDGVHPNARGVALLADHIAAGIHRALSD